MPSRAKEYSPKVYGQRLREARTAAGLTQQQLAERVGCTDRRVIWSHEAGTVDPSRSFILRAAAALAVDAGWLAAF